MATQNHGYPGDDVQPAGFSGLALSRQCRFPKQKRKTTFTNKILRWMVSTANLSSQFYDYVFLFILISYFMLVCSFLFLNSVYVDHGVSLPQLFDDCFAEYKIVSLCISSCFSI